MKTLYIIRHAKSSWEHEDLHDLERPLTERGKKNALLMGEVLRKYEAFPDEVISSPALRAVATTRILCEELGFDSNKMLIEPDLYFREVEDIIQLLHRRQSRPDKIFITGHNPAFTNLANVLIPGFTEMIPTCGVVAVHFNIESWGLLKIGSGQLAFFEYPKKFR